MIQIQSSSGRWAPLVARIEAFLAADTIALHVGGHAVTGFRSPDSPALWIRDHADILRGGVYTTPDVGSAVEAFARAQGRDGRVFDFVTTQPTPTARENWETWVRVPVEADVEYRFVQAAFLAWRASADTARLARMLPALDAALVYTTTDPERWCAGEGLVMRAYTIDTWDFDYTAHRAPWLNFQITGDTFWGLSHADNSGLFEAMHRLARLYDAARESGDVYASNARARADHWRAAADALRARATARLWNGRHYTHFVPLTPGTEIDGVDAARQLSLSTPMAVNRGLADAAMGRAIADEYAARGAAPSTAAGFEHAPPFAPWFSIDPPFPTGTFGDDKLVPGAYVNGGILPLVGGELALAALTCGREAFGVAQLDTYARLVAETGASYLWYFPDGTPSSVETSTSPEALPTDGWGSAAMLHALATGLAGVDDTGAGFAHVRLSPRWAAAGEDAADVRLAYAASGAALAYAYRHDAAARAVTLDVAEAPGTLDVRLLLPAGATSATDAATGAALATERVDASVYAHLPLTRAGSVAVRYAMAEDAPEAPAATSETGGGRG